MARRVPEPDSEFDQYIRNTTNILETGTPDTGAVRLGLSTAQSTQWIAYRDQWLIIYPKYTDPAQRTTAIKDDKNKLKSDFTDFAEKPLKIIEMSDNITTADRATFHLPEPDRTPTARGEITDVPYGKLKGTGGGMLEVRALQESNATHASMHPLADVVELKYLLTSASGGSDTPIPPVPNPPPGGSDAIPLPDDMPNSVLSKSALWRINLGTDAQGKRIIAYMRWVNLTDPENNSGWSDLVTTIIS